MRPLRRIRLLPALLGAMAILLGVKLESLLRAAMPPLPHMELVTAAQAVGAEPTPAATPPLRDTPAQRHPSVAVATPTPEQSAERALLEGLRARRAELEAREQALAAREMVLAAAERRLTQRVEELTALQQRLQAMEKANAEREEAGWKQMVKIYEGMRPRNAAAIFDELDLPVLVQIVDRMAERKAAPVLGAMRPDRARQLTTELARRRASSTD